MSFSGHSSRDSIDSSEDGGARLYSPSVSGSTHRSDRSRASNTEQTTPSYNESGDRASGGGALYGSSSTHHSQYVTGFPPPVNVGQGQSTALVHSQAFPSRQQQPGPPQGFQGYVPSETPTLSLAQSLQNLSIAVSNEQNLHPACKALIQHIRYAQQRIFGLRQAIQRQPGLPREFTTSFDLDIQALIADVVEQSRAADTLATEMKSLASECDGLKAALGSQTLEHQRFRNNAESKMKELNEELENEREKTQRAERRAAYLQEKQIADQNMIEGLKQQLEGKRNLWMTIHSDPEERAMVLAANTRSSSPYTGTTYGSDNPSSSMSGDEMSLPGSSDMISPQVHPQHPALAGNRHGQRNMRNSGRSRNSRSGDGRHPQQTHSGVSEYGSPAGRKAPSTVVARSFPVIEDDETTMEWRKEFQRLFYSLEGFSVSYTSGVATGVAAGVKRSSPVLWNRICEILYPNNLQNGDAHATCLLDDDGARPYLVARLLIQHVVENILSYQGWLGFDGTTDKELTELANRLRTGDLFKTHERQAAVDGQAAIVSKIIAHPKFRSFQNWKKNEHFAKIKAIVGPLLSSSRPNSTVMSDASYDLFSIVDAAWMLSAKLFNSRLSFQYVWGETCIKFSQELHDAIETREDPRYLQAKQMRLKLVAVPGVTMRNDQGMSILPKRLLKAKVLLMP
ncbi:hypothetical protein B0T19DRAFT_487203 [Cercophora scortea]|uniref:Uncharacterized protein n=1 Tax=Cercophora scortea TaxID=314031 RepID=A0AAE0M605_9PEZI|nr:hypothetical protein B0T19DRAFT_487203 [Cercophora scortea]